VFRANSAIAVAEVRFTAVPTQDNNTNNQSTGEETSRKREDRKRREQAELKEGNSSTSFIQFCGI
jgi:hypothetical protein